MSLFVDKLRTLAESTGIPGSLANIVLDDPRFGIWTGSAKPGHHHYGDGGLAEHVWEVVSLCLENNRFFDGTSKYEDPKKLFLAALFHDIGKLHDYQLINNEWKSVDHKYKIHHITRSAIVWSEALARWNRDNACSLYFSDPNDDVLHAILAHHGEPEWGSPVRPKTRIAWLLHLCDQMSARLDDCETSERAWAHKAERLV